MKTYEELTKSLENEYEQKKKIFEEERKENYKKKLEKEEKNIVKKLEKTISNWRNLQVHEGYWMSNFFTGKWITNENALDEAMNRRMAGYQMPGVYGLRTLRNETCRQEALELILSHIDQLRINKDSIHAYMGQSVITTEERIQNLFQEKKQGIILKNNELEEIETLARNALKELFIWLFGETKNLYHFYQTYFKLTSHRTYYFPKEKQGIFSNVPQRDQFYHMSAQEAAIIKMEYQHFISRYYTEDEIEYCFQEQMKEKRFEKIYQYLYISKQENILREQLIDSMYKEIKDEVKIVEENVKSIQNQESFHDVSELKTPHENKWKRWYGVINTLQQEKE